MLCVLIASILIYQNVDEKAITPPEIYALHPGITLREAVELLGPSFGFATNSNYPIVLRWQDDNGITLEITFYESYELPPGKLELLGPDKTEALFEWTYDSKATLATLRTSDGERRALFSVDP